MITLTTMKMAPNTFVIMIKYLWLQKYKIYSIHDIFLLLILIKEITLGA